MVHEHSEASVLVCKHLNDPKVMSFVVDGGDEPTVLCESCAEIDWSKVDWKKGEEVSRRADVLRLTPGSKEIKELYKTNGPPELDNLILECKSCVLEELAKRIDVSPDERIESIGPCADCGKPILVKHGLAAGIRRLVSANQSYFFDVRADEKKLTITIHKTGSSRVTESGH